MSMPVKITVDLEDLFDGLTANEKKEFVKSHLDELDVDDIGTFIESLGFKITE